MMFERLERMKEFGFFPAEIIDIGANVGEWNRDVRKIWPYAHVHSFEANPDCEGALKGAGIDYTIALLGDKSDWSCTFYSTKNEHCGTGASIFKEQTSFFEDKNVVARKLPMKRLDDLLGGAQRRYDLIKLDVQGAELLVLEGAKKVLEKTDFVLMEVSILKFNQGAPLFAEVIEYMNGLGFKVFDILEPHYVKGVCLQADVLFLNARSEWPRKIAEVYSKTTPWKVDSIY